MIYEFREYRATPGKLPALNERFEARMVDLLARHDIRPMGFWENMVGRGGTLRYLIPFRDAQHLLQSWEAFRRDSEVAQVFEETERGGPLVAEIRNQLWRPTAYSDLQ